MRISIFVCGVALIVTTLLILSDAYAEASRSTESFVKKVAIANAFEIDSSKMAVDKSSSEKVKDFARMMITDHTKAGNDFKSALKNSEMKDASLDDTDSDHQDMLDDLSGKKGAEFDRDYINDQVNAHDEAVALFRDYSENGDDPALKQFAARTLPTLVKHQEHIRALQNSYKR